MNQELTNKFAALHRQDCFVMPNAWDPGSAKLMASMGFAAIGTTSAGIAFARGKADYSEREGQVTMGKADALEQIKAIRESIKLPMNADLESGYAGDDEDVYQTIRDAIDIGISGFNLEDFSGDFRSRLFPIDQARSRVAAAAKAIRDTHSSCVLTARCDSILASDSGSLRDAIIRCNHYRELGADCLFVPGVTTKQQIATLVSEIDGPINVVMGLKDSPLSVQELQDLGVRRISIGGSLARAMYLNMKQALSEILHNGTFGYAENQTPQNELNELFSR